MTIHDPIRAQWLKGGFIAYFGANEQNDMHKNHIFAKTILIVKIIRKGLNSIFQCVK